MSTVVNFKSILFVIGMMVLCLSGNTSELTLSSDHYDIPADGKFNKAVDGTLKVKIDVEKKDELWAAITILDPNISAKDIKVEGSGWTSINIYPIGTKIWNKNGKIVKAENLLIDFFIKSPVKGKKYPFCVYYKTKKVDTTVFLVRSALIRGKKEYREPDSSNHIDQQGYPCNREKVRSYEPPDPYPPKVSVYGPNPITVDYGYSLPLSINSSDNEKVNRIVCSLTNWSKTIENPKVSESIVIPADALKAFEGRAACLNVFAYDRINSAQFIFTINVKNALPAPQMVCVDKRTVTFSNKPADAGLQFEIYRKYCKQADWESVFSQSNNNSYIKVSDFIEWCEVYGVKVRVQYARNGAVSSWSELVLSDGYGLVEESQDLGKSIENLYNGKLLVDLRENHFNQYLYERPKSGVIQDGRNKLEYSMMYSNCSQGSCSSYINRLDVYRGVFSNDNVSFASTVVLSEYDDSPTLMDLSNVSSFAYSDGNEFYMEAIRSFIDPIATGSYSFDYSLSYLVEAATIRFVAKLKEVGLKNFNWEVRGDPWKLDTETNKPFFSKHVADMKERIRTDINKVVRLVVSVDNGRHTFDKNPAVLKYFSPTDHPPHMTAYYWVQSTEDALTPAIKKANNGNIVPNLIDYAQKEKAGEITVFFKEAVENGKPVYNTLAFKKGAGVGVWEEASHLNTVIRDPVADIPEMFRNILSKTEGVFTAKDGKQITFALGLPDDEFKVFSNAWKAIGSSASRFASFVRGNFLYTSNTMRLVNFKNLLVTGVKSSIKGAFTAAEAPAWVILALQIAYNDDVKYRTYCVDAISYYSLEHRGWLWNVLAFTTGAKANSGTKDEFLCNIITGGDPEWILGPAWDDHATFNGAPGSTISVFQDNGVPIASGVGSVTFSFNAPQSVRVMYWPNPSVTPFVYNLILEETRTYTLSNGDISSGPVQPSSSSSSNFVTGSRLGGSPGAGGPGIQSTPIIRNF